MGENWIMRNLKDLCFLPNVIRVIKSGKIWWAGHVACMGEKNSAQDLFHIPEGKRPPGKPRCRQDNVKMDFPSISCPSTPVILYKFCVLL